MTAELKLDLTPPKTVEEMRADRVTALEDALCCASDAINAQEALSELVLGDRREAYVARLVMRAHDAVQVALDEARDLIAKAAKPAPAVHAQRCDGCSRCAPDHVDLGGEG